MQAYVIIGLLPWIRWSLEAARRPLHRLICWLPMALVAFAGFWKVHFPDWRGLSLMAITDFACFFLTFSIGNHFRMEAIRKAIEESERELNAQQQSAPKLG